MPNITRIYKTFFTETIGTSKTFLNAKNNRKTEPLLKWDTSITFKNVIKVELITSLPSRKTFTFLFHKFSF